MLLTLKDRILLIQVLPAESDVFSQRIVRDLKAQLGLSEEDWKTYDIVKSGEDGIQWNLKKDIGVEYSFGVKATEIIVSALNDISKAKKVNGDLLLLFDKFIPEEKPEINVTVKV
jgi:hypothetical protein